jgi:hypothetical protein
VDGGQNFDQAGFGDETERPGGEAERQRKGNESLIDETLSLSQGTELLVRDTERLVDDTKRLANVLTNQQGRWSLQIQRPMDTEREGRERQVDETKLSREDGSESGGIQNRTEAPPGKFDTEAKGMDC